MSGRKLIYLYVNSLSICFVEQGFLFSKEFEVKFDADDGELIINRNKDFTPFFEDNCVKDVTLIVGKNGSGKSTILDLLGSAINENSKHFGFRKQQVKRTWFAVYHEQDDVYSIEGFLIDSSFIKNIKFLKTDKSNVPIKLDKNSLIKMKRIEKGKNIFFEEIEVDKLKENQKILYFYDRNLQSKEWATGYNYKVANEDSTSSYTRITLGEPKGIHVYDFLTTIFEDVEDEFFASEIVASLNVNKNDMSQTKEEFILFCMKTISLNLELKIEFMSRDKKRSKKDLENEIKKFFEVVEGKIHSDLYVLLKSFFKHVHNDSELIFSRKYNGLMIPIKKQLSNETQQLMKLVTNISEEPELHGILPLEVKINNLSSGEANLLNIFTKIYETALHHVKYNETASIILLLDEPEMHFHPEWARRFLDNLISTLNLLNLREVSYQIIIATHSPFLISDVPKGNIICLEASIEEGKTVRKVVPASFGLMSNYYEIVKNNFFMNQTIGQHANRYFENIISKINSLSNDSSIDDLRTLRNKIDLIDESFIRDRLHNYLNQAMKNNVKFAKNNLEQQKKDLERNLARINKEIERL